MTKQFDPHVVIPSVSAADMDICVMSWERGRKMVTVFLTAYGTAVYRCGLCKPAGGVAAVATFSEAWKWFCDLSVTELPEDIGDDHRTRPPVKAGK
jgi:hypothetical protein